MPSRSERPSLEWVVLQARVRGFPMFIAVVRVQGGGPCLEYKGFWSEPFAKAWAVWTVAYYFESRAERPPEPVEPDDLRPSGVGASRAPGREGTKRSRKVERAFRGAKLKEVR